MNLPLKVELMLKNHPFCLQHHHLWFQHTLGLGFLANDCHTECECLVKLNQRKSSSKLVSFHHDQRSEFNRGVIHIIMSSAMKQI